MVFGTKQILFSHFFFQYCRLNTDFVNNQQRKFYSSGGESQKVNVDLKLKVVDKLFTSIEELAGFFLYVYRN